MALRQGRGASKGDLPYVHFAASWTWHWGRVEQGGQAADDSDLEHGSSSGDE